MRIVIFGAGAVGSVIGGRLHQHRDAHGHDVTLVARPAHAAAIRAAGLVLHSPDGTHHIDVPVVEQIADAALQDGDVVILTVKTQDTQAALDQLGRHTEADVAVVCAQNGVENERIVARRIHRTYAMCVILPATFLEPGVVDAFGAPHNAILDLGRFPVGVDATATQLAAALTTSTLISEALDDVMPVKYRKLLMNLNNPIDALVEPGDAATRLGRLAADEATRCLAAAGITPTPAERDRQRRHGVMEVQPIPGRERGGGSTWQSLARGSDSTEVDYLNGEIVLLGRLHGVATPVNTMLCRTMHRAAADGITPRSLSAEALLASVDLSGEPS